MRSLPRMSATLHSGRRQSQASAQSDLALILVPDAHLAARAIEHGLTCCSTDGDQNEAAGATAVLPGTPTHEAALPIDVGAAQMIDGVQSALVASKSR
jgi:hypothetical protein